MTTYRAVAATSASYELAEGVLWDDRTSLLRWVDIWRGRVLAGTIADGAITVVEDLDLGETAGAVALAEDGGLLIAGARRLVARSPEGALSFGPDLLGSRRDVRLNDGAVDPQGRFLVGTLALGEVTGQEVLLRVDPDGTVETLRSGLRLANGVAFSPDGRTVYHVDTLAGTVASHSYGPGAFDHDEPWAVVVDDLPHPPDGLTTDADGALWIAQWGGSEVRRHDVEGALLATVAVDATQATCPAFVGANLDVLAITTAQEGLDSWTDHSGAIFLATAGSTGLPAPRWRGSTTSPPWHTQREERTP